MPAHFRFCFCTDTIGSTRNPSPFHCTYPTHGRHCQLHIQGVMMMCTQGQRAQRCACPFFFLFSVLTRLAANREGYALPLRGTYPTYRCHHRLCVHGVIIPTDAITDYMYDSGHKGVLALFFLLFFCTDATGSKWEGLYPPPPRHMPYLWMPSLTTRTWRDNNM